MASGSAIRRNVVDLERFSDGQCVDHLTDGFRQRTETGFDQFDQSPRHGRFADPLPVAVLLLNSAVGDFLLDDVAQIKSVPARQLPQPGSGVGIHWPAQRGRQQLGDLAGRKRLQVKSAELAAAEYFVYLGRNTFALADGQHYLGGLALHDLVQDERRQFVEQMDVVDSPAPPWCRAARMSPSRSRREPVEAGQWPPDPAHGANAPRGSLRADVVPTAQRGSKPWDAADDSASRAIRLFPTPAGPLTRIPATPGSDMAATMVRISSERPINGHVKRTSEA